VGKLATRKGQECQTNPISALSGLKTPIVPENKPNSKPISARSGCPCPACLADPTFCLSSTKPAPDPARIGVQECKTKPILAVSGLKTPLARKNKPNSEPIAAGVLSAVERISPPSDPQTPLGRRKNADLEPIRARVVRQVRLRPMIARAGLPVYSWGHYRSMVGFDSIFHGE
jgi:hypothetical protein